jgi:hypothetical protein
MVLVGEGKRRGGKRSVAAILALALFVMSPLAAASAEKGPGEAQDLTVLLDGKAVSLTDAWRMRDNRLYAPVAHLARLFGAQIRWDPKTDEVTLATALGDRVVLGDGVPVVYFNDARYLLSAPPFMADGRMYVPVRDAAEMMHASAVWDGATRTLRLESVAPLSVTEETDLAAIVEQLGIGEAELLRRNKLNQSDEIKAGTTLRIVLPAFLEREAEPFTEEDFELLAKITMVEAGYESYEAQLAVANVILNRVKDPRFPNTIRDVIYAGKQFPPAHNGLLDRSVPSETAKRAARDALNGKNNIQDAVYFYNPKVTKGKFWSSLTVVDTVGSHRFAK